MNVEYLHPFGRRILSFIKNVIASFECPFVGPLYLIGIQCYRFHTVCHCILEKLFDFLMVENFQRYIFPMENRLRSLRSQRFNQISQESVLISFSCPIITSR